MDQVGYDPRSAYCEKFWLGVLGPSCLWFLRHVADRFDLEPDGFDLDLARCASAIGLGRQQGPSAAFSRMLTRCSQFGVARAAGAASLEVRRLLSPLSQRQVEKLSQDLQAEHARWVDSAPAAAEVAALSDRARRLALSLLELGEHPLDAERQLHRWRFHPALAREAMTWAIDRHLGLPDDTTPAGTTPGHPRGPQPRGLDAPGDSDDLAEKAEQLQATPEPDLEHGGHANSTTASQDPA